MSPKPAEEAWAVECAQEEAWAEEVWAVECAQEEVWADYSPEQAASDKEDSAQEEANGSPEETDEISSREPEDNSLAEDSSSGPARLAAGPGTT